MNDVTKPTAEDMAVDLAAAIRLWELSTRGHWLAFDGPDGVYAGQIHAIEGDAMGGRLTHILSTPEGDERDDDIRFVANAHEAAPAAYSRALWAEGFKAFVHGWLDTAGVPHDPDAEQGCRIKARLQWLLSRAEQAEAEAEGLRISLETAYTRLPD